MARSTNKTKEPKTYQITIKGELNEKWADWLDGFVIKLDNQNGVEQDTVVTAAVPDQAALRGLLNKLWDLNLNLISVILYTEDGGANGYELHS